MPEYVKYLVTPVEGELPTVCIKTDVSGGPWVDESRDIVIKALQPEAVPLMQAYLAGLSLDTSWTARESGGSAFRKESLVPGQTRQVSLNSCSEYKRSPKDWFSLLFGTPPANETDEFANLLEITMLDERLAEQMYEAVIAGALQIDFA